MVRGKAVLLVVASLLMAGCLAMPRWSDEVASDAPREGGPGPRVVDVEVTGADGPLEASVILMWFHNEETWQQDRTAQLRLLGLRSDDGHVRGHVPADRDIYVVAGARDHTEEWTPVPLPAATGPAVHRVRLYAIAQETTINGTWDGVELGNPELWPYLAGNAPWSPHPLHFAADEASSQAIMARLVDLRGALRWENTPTRTGDLGVMLATGEEGEYCRFHDDGRELAPGPQVQPFEVPYDSPCALSFFGTDLPEPPIFIGPATQSHMVAPLEGLPYQITLQGLLADSWGWRSLDEALDGATVDRHWVDPGDGGTHAGGRSAHDGEPYAEGEDASFEPHGGAGRESPGPWPPFTAALLVAVALLRRRTGRP